MIAPDPAPAPQPAASSARRRGRVPLDPDEELHAAADAVLRGGLRARLDFGFLWPRFLQVRLLATDRRLIELARPFGGRAPGHRVRSWSWQEVVSAEVSRRDLQLSSAAGDRVRWRILDPRQAARMEAFLACTRPLQEGRTPEPCGPGRSPSRCPACSAPLRPKPARCPFCDARYVTPRAAGWLAVALPGGGHLATGHWVVGAGRACTEVLTVLALWLALMDAQIIREVPFMAVIFAGALVGLKLEAVLTARAFAHLLVPWSGRARRLWSVAGGVGAGLLVAWALSATVLAGQITRTVWHDLEFHDADQLGWEARYLPRDDRDLDEATLRSSWAHADGWRLEVLAQPLPPFATPEEWLRRENRRRQEDGLAPGELVRAGVVDGARFLTPDPAGGGDLVEVEVAVFDRRHRAVHTIICHHVPQQTEAVDLLLLRLLRRAHWTRAGLPSKASWAPE